MIHPSYNELYEAINKDNANESPVVTSRYSICTATAKRAKQLIEGAEPFVTAKCDKPLSTAIEEIYKGKVTILNPDDDLDYQEYSADMYADETPEE